MAQTFRISQWRKSKVNYISALISRQITANATLFACKFAFPQPNSCLFACLATKFYVFKDSYLRASSTDL